MTSLAQQLQRLALPQSDPSLLSRHEVASLLFDPKEAATIDRDTAFAIGKSNLWIDAVKGRRASICDRCSAC
jgi:U3 small nucleolar RNA-associated protein 10